MSAPIEVPFGDLRRNTAALRDEIEQALGAVLDDGWFVLGERVERFERAFAAACEVDAAVGVGNGTDAIALALRALGVGPGDEVITSPLSAAFTALGVSQIGAVPVFADIDPATCTVAPAAVEAAITPRTRALLPVHLYGQPANTDALRALATAHDLWLVEDAAQAHGARWRGRPVGALGDAAAFSFYPSKNLGAYGDGGAVTTDHPDVAERVRRLRNGGQSARYEHELRGVNSRLDELQAAVLEVRLRRLAADNARRRQIAKRYDAALAGRATRPVAVADDAESVYHLYVVRTPDRATLAARLAEDGIATAVHYPTPIHLQPAYDGPAGRGRCPEAERAADEVLSLPIFPELTEREVGAVADALARATAPTRTL